MRAHRACATRSRASPTCSLRRRRTWMRRRHCRRCARARQADILHLATHGRFRPDNPLFSALRLADGWLTVRDACELDLHGCGLVALSACETGVSQVAPGDELLGMTRGFFASGAASLLVSLWPVDDAATVDLMVEFYRRLADGAARPPRCGTRSVSNSGVRHGASLLLGRVRRAWPLVISFARARRGVVTLTRFRRQT